MNEGAKVILGIFILIVWIATAKFVWGDFLASLQRGTIPIGIFIPLLLTGVILGFAWIGRLLASAERRILLDFLRDAIEAREVFANREEAIEHLWRRQ